MNVLVSNIYLKKAGTSGYPHITREQYEKIMQSLLNKDIIKRDVAEKAMLLKLLWLFGLRITEALQIRPCDFVKREDGYVLHINRLKKRRRHVDDIEIPNEVAFEYISWCSANKLKPDERLFKINRQTAHRFISHLGKKVLGIKLFPHMFRHGRVYELVKAGISPILIAKMMGWSSINMVMNYYHPQVGDMRSKWS